MKKIIALITLLMISASTLIYAQEKSREERRAERKAERERLIAEELAANQLAYTKAIEAIKEKKFVLEATQVMFKRGQTAFVASNTNFILMDGDRATVQIAFDGYAPGPNGIGGITVDGNAVKVDVKIDKRGNANISFSTQGVGISAQIYITMPNGTNNATVTVAPNYNSNALTLVGNLVPLSESNVYKGRAI